MSETNKFLVRYASGLEQTVHSMCESVEAFCNEHFGSGWGDAKANGASVTMNGDAIEASAPVDAPADPAPVEVAEAPAQEAPQSVLEEIRHEAADLLHKAEHALGLDR